MSQHTDVGWGVTTVTVYSSCTIRTHSEIGSSMWTNVASRSGTERAGIVAGFGLHRHRWTLRFPLRQTAGVIKGRHFAQTCRQMFLQPSHLVAPGIPSREKQV